MKKRICSLILTVLMVLTLMPMAAFAEEPTVLYVGGRGMTADEIAVDQECDGWSWDASESVLTLSGYDGGAVSAIDSLVINVADGTENTITVDEDSDWDAVYAEGDITLCGGGDLEIVVLTDGYYGICSVGNVCVEMDGYLSISGESDSYGICADDGIYISGGGDIDIVVGDDSYGIASFDCDVRLSGSGDVNITAGDEKSAGIYAEQCANISGSGNLTIDIGEGGCGIYSYSDSIKFSGSVAADVTVGEEGVGLCAFSDSVSISDSADITVDSGDKGIYAEYSVFNYGSGTVEITA